MELDLLVMIVLIDSSYLHHLLFFKSFQGICHSKIDQNYAFFFFFIPNQYRFF